MGSEDQHETRLLRGAPLAKRLHAEISASRAYLRSLGGREPVLATLLVGDNAAAMAYRSSIQRGFTKANIAHRPVELPATTSEPELVEAVRALNDNPEITGILVLMPLPDGLNPHVVLEHLSPLKDVDGITPTNAGRLHLGLPSLRPSTPAGGLELLDFYGVDLIGREVVVVGRSNVVGRPLATLLTQRHATVTLCHSKTKDLGRETHRADVVCVAAGVPGLITGKMIKSGATVLDFGVNVTREGKIVGDADAASMQGIASGLTPVPGGTGPVTTLVLARNTLAAGFAALGGNLDHVTYTIPEDILLAHLAI
jgi:methylenetetrahydrofolate dehydrogenase (NADP+)/methenyltetrahydrofolate cyclohydrolase